MSSKQRHKDELKMLHRHTLWCQTKMENRLLRLLHEALSETCLDLLDIEPDVQADQAEAAALSDFRQLK